MVLSLDGHAELRALLLEAAREILDEPDTALDLRKVAERAGKSRTAPYLVFGKTEEGGGLDALKVAVAAEGFEAMTRAVSRALRRPADPEARLRVVGREYLTFAEENPRLYRLMFGPEVSRAVTHALTDAPPRQEVHTLLLVRARLEDVFRWVVEEAQDTGVLAFGEATRHVLASWALFHGAAMLLLDGQLELSGIISGDAVAALVLPLLLDESAAGLEEPARWLAEARERRGLSPEDSPSPGARSADPGPDPRLVAMLRNAAGPGVPDEVWDLATRPRGKVPADLAGVRSQVSRSSALRRARRMHDVLAGSRVTWMTGGAKGSAGEDPPEVGLLRSLGVEVTTAGTGIPPASRNRRDGVETIDLVIVAVGGTPPSPKDLARLQLDLPGRPLLLYTPELEPGTARPPGSAGLTDDPSELLHLVLDLLERVRL